MSPPGYSCTSQLLCFAKSIDINLQIIILDNHPLQNLNTQTINSSPDETLIVCAQLLTAGGVLVEVFGLSSAAFKGRESDEERVVEGEAAKALTNLDEMNEGKEKWSERMRSNFMGQVLGERTVDEARALLRNYDSNWEMRVEGKYGCVGLWWKGQPASFCSLWKLGHESK
ncbi:GRAS family transcription factor [Actinidia rufa]|uniref:GRAS family transcription factor n=1 Tax=Actinidia rufa TaxID=165716 RepID=A0A7J0G030_9ERIC|nr:GRAS family transcription factor [Actinidia rufa]